MNAVERLYGDDPDILLVEDDPRQCAEFEDFFQLIGVSYRIATDGPTAMRFLETSLPRIVLMDIRLPGASGIEVSKAILRRAERPVVLLMSGHTESVFEAHQSAGRAFRVIEKPIDLRVLAKFIDDVLSRPYHPGNGSGDVADIP